MHTRRRDFIWGAGAAFVLTGCQKATRTADALPGAYWPQVERPAVPQPLPPIAAEPEPAPPSGNLGTPTRPIPRSQWARYGPRMSNIDPMNGVNRITLHHTGMRVVSFDDFSSSTDYIDMIRASHAGKGWADIGYHYIIDRAGRVYEGRSVNYQGAHVGKENNPHNLGIMCLGNFELQQPSDAQLRALAQTVSHLRRRHKVAANRIYTHRELTPTVCPGKFMQPRIVAMRSNNAFA
jgi:hypothetical protein